MIRKLFLVVGSVVVAPAAVAQSNGIKLNLLSPVASTLSLSYEHVVKTDQSFQLQVSRTWSGSGRGMFGVAPEYRFYLSDQPAPQGAYLAPFLRFQHLNVQESYYYQYQNDAASSINVLGLGLLLGRQWVFKDRVTFDMFIGPAYNTSNDKNNNPFGFTNQYEGLPIITNGFSLRGGLTLGLRWR